MMIVFVGLLLVFFGYFFLLGFLFSLFFWLCFFLFFCLWVFYGYGKNGAVVLSFWCVKENFVFCKFGK